MPVATSKPSRSTRRSSSVVGSPSSVVGSSSSVLGPPSSALILIDQSRLQGAAWADYHSAQKAHQKAARDLHRHEEVDTPAYEKWLHGTFPVLVTTLRNLQEEVSTKGRQVRFVRAMAASTGRSAKKLWQELKAGGSEARSSGDPDDADPSDPSDPEDLRDFDPAFRPRHRARGQAYAARHAAQPARPERSNEARDIYRRLVQRLHPDRGGDWTPARKRLWHEVQLAWAKGDADWLARLEVELVSSVDLEPLGLRDSEPLSATSPLSRLRRAIAELHAARRDTERKLREYRETPPWRFTLAAKKRPALRRRTEDTLREDLDILQRQLTHLDKAIRAWEEPTLGRSKPRHTTPDW